jgi:hypothetical protein
MATTDTKHLHSVRKQFYHCIGQRIFKDKNIRNPLRSIFFLPFPISILLLLPLNELQRKQNKCDLRSLWPYPCFKLLSPGISMAKVFLLFKA